MKKKEITKIEYVAAVGRRFTDEDAAILGPYLTALSKEHGKLTRQLLLSIAEEDPESPLRDYIEWDDETAARRYRLTQAGDILRSIKYRVTIGKKVVESRMFENVVITNELPDVVPGRGYVSAQTVYTHVDLTQQVLDRARKELLQWKQRYEIHAQLASQFAYMFQAIATWEEEVTTSPAKKRQSRQIVAGGR